MSEATNLRESLGKFFEGSGSLGGLLDRLENLHDSLGNVDREGLPRVIVALAGYSFDLRRMLREKRGSAAEGLSVSGVIINEEIFNEAVKIVKPGGSFEEVKSYLTVFAACYQTLVSLPNLFLSEGISQEKADKFLEIVYCKISGKRSSVLEDGFLMKEFSELNKRALEGTRERVKGIYGEIFCFFLFRRLGFGIRRASASEDIKGSDFFAKQSKSVEVALQVETGRRRSGFGMFDIVYETSQNRIIVGIDPERMARVPGLVDTTIVWDVPRSEGGGVIIPDKPPSLKQIREQICRVTNFV